MINTCHPGCGKKWRNITDLPYQLLQLSGSTWQITSLPPCPSRCRNFPRSPSDNLTREMFGSRPATFLSNCSSHLDRVQFNTQTDSSEWRWSVLPSLQGSCGWQGWKSEVDRRSELFLFGSQSRRPPGVGVQAFPEEALFAVTQRGEPDADSSSSRTASSSAPLQIKGLHRLPLCEFTDLE